jgi:hypothetical protein
VAESREGLTTVAPPKGFQIGKIIWCQHVSLDDCEGEVNFMEPAGVDRGIDHNDIGIDATQPLPRSFTAM